MCVMTCTCGIYTETGAAQTTNPKHTEHPSMAASSTAAKSYADKKHDMKEEIRALEVSIKAINKLHQQNDNNITTFTQRAVRILPGLIHEDAMASMMRMKIMRDLKTLNEEYERFGFHLHKLLDSKKGDLEELKKNKKQLSRKRLREEQLDESDEVAEPVAKKGKTISWDSDEEETQKPDSPEWQKVMLDENEDSPSSPCYSPSAPAYMPRNMVMQPGSPVAPELSSSDDDEAQFDWSRNDD